MTTRAALTTGLHPRQGERGLLRPEMVTLGEVMQQAGYATSYTGKWHLGSVSPKRPIDRGFDEYYGLLSGCCNYFNPAKQDPIFYNGGTYPSTFNGHSVLPMEGKSQVPIFHGQQRAGHESLCWALYGNRAIRSGDWKLVWGASDRRWELYNLARDRTETMDLADQYPERVRNMAAEWQDWAKRTEVKQ